MDLKRGTEPAVSPDGSEVAILTKDDKIAVFDSSGKVLWQDKVPRSAVGPVYTTIDSKRVVAVAAPETLFYWAGDGAQATELELPNSARVSFFGTSPLIVLRSDAGASIISGGELKPLPVAPRSATLLLAEGEKVLLARYGGPLYWQEPGKETTTLVPKRPRGATDIHHIVAASPGQALVVWNTKSPELVIPTVNSTANGAVLATCPNVSMSQVGGWRWVPDEARKVAAWGECTINYTTNKTVLFKNFQPQSVTGTTVYGALASNPYAGTPAGKFYELPKETARPWGVAGPHAIVVHNSVLYALDKK